MKEAARPFPLILLAATAALVVAFYFQTRLMDLDRHNAIAQDLLHLKQLDTQLNENTLKAVSLQLVHYDSIVSTVSQMKQISNRLHDPDTGLYGLVSSGVDGDLNTFRSLMLTKFDLVETVKSSASIVRNTLNYIPLELNRITAERHEPEVIAMHRMLSALYAQNLLPTEQTYDAFLNAIAGLQRADLGPEDRSAIDKVLVHARANLQSQEEIASAMTQFLKLPTLETLDSIYNAYASYSLERIRAANQYRTALLLLTLMLFAGLAVALIQVQRAHSAANRQSRQFRDAAESIAEGFAFFDSDNRLEFWNSTFLRLHAKLGDTLRRGITFADFHKACVDADIYRDFVFGKGRDHDTMVQALGHPYVVKSADGTWMLASDSRMSDGGTACVRVDISANKHAEEELRKLSRAVDQSPASVMITDTEGVITYVNPKFCELTGYTTDEIIGQKPNILSTGKMEPAEYKALWNTLAAGDEWHGEFLNKRKDGSTFWEYASISPVKNDAGVTTHFLAVKEDITERKETMTQLVEAKEQAEQANRAKTQFLANMSHELRTPLNAIIGFSEMIKSQLFGPVGNDNYIEYSNNILSSGQHLLNVINDILDVSRIEAGTMNIREDTVQIMELCDECIGMVREEAEDKDLILRETVQDDLPDLLCDAIRMRQLILNLLTNAVKFTPQGGKIDLLAHLEDDGTFTLVVRDTGVGIPADKINVICEPFEQVSDIYTRSHEGSGLGLFLAGSFAKMHGGTLDIQSKVDVGTTVTVRLPAARIASRPLSAE